ncbi:spore gernimation protein GerPD [Lederbergia sp. NSJ-179]|uniref:spore gernimation protein GerPD n=1 Tax=Lederbergia sp. NSJ-179 TaxID=2931402 RepID=UPI001FD0680A|nr:spore gernimation protein GerPD [Lederbergia sp. NSJ-179]MCJ7840384.1 spore gernimation protein GerPD [Lederbergia sp. NSJ-179]
MNLNVVNRELCVGEIQITGVTTSSLFLVGDADTIQLASTFDTPPESLIIGPFVPLPSEDENGET